MEKGANYLVKGKVFLLHYLLFYHTMPLILIIMAIKSDTLI